MRRILGALVAILLLSVLTAPFAAGETVQSADGRGAGWTVRVESGVDGVPDTEVVLVPDAIAAVPPCPPDPPCADSDQEELLNQVVGDPLAPAATASLLRAEANANEAGDISATLQTQMNAASQVTLTANDWNARGYARVTGFTALNGAIRADVLEAEAVSGTRLDGTNLVNAAATGARIDSLTLAGVLSGYPLTAPVAGAVNQVLLDVQDPTLGAVKIVFWETNWDPATAATSPPGERVWVNTLHITAPGVDIRVAQSDALSTYVAPPVANDDTITTPGERIDIDVLGNDDNLDDDANPTISVTDGPDHGTVDCSSGVCVYEPGDGFYGTDTFTYEVCDDVGQCDQATVTVTVVLPPIANDDEVGTLPDTPIAIQVTANDSDGGDGDGVDPASVKVVAGKGPANGQVTCAPTPGDPTSATCSYEPNAGFTGKDWFTYEVCDNSGYCDTALVTVTVAPPPPPGNRPPVANDDSATTLRNTATTINVIANDSDPDGSADLRPESVRVIDGPSNGTVECSAGPCTYTPNTGFTGTDTFTYEVCDQAWTCDTATVTIAVVPPPPPPAVNQPPTAGDDTATTTPATPVEIDVTANDNDPEGDLDESSLRITDPPANGSVDCAGGSCTYTPDDGFTGTDQFTYEICDGTGACDQATVVIVVEPTTPGNSPPSAQDDSASTRAGVAVPITVTQNDTDPDGDLDTSSVRIVTQPDNGSVVCVGSLCTYTPDPGFTGTDTFVYEVCDAAGACDTAVVTIVVGEGNDNTDGGDGGGAGGGGNGPGGSGGGANGPEGNNDGGSGGEPGSDTNPSSPAPGSSTGFPLAAPDPLLPALGAPGSGLPFTGMPAGYLIIAMYLLGAGSLSLMGSRLGSFRSRRGRRDDSAPPPRPIQPAAPTRAELQPSTVDQTAAAEISDVEVTHPAPTAMATPQPNEPSAARKKSTAKKSSPKKTTAKKTTAKKPAPKKSATAKKTTVKKPASQKSATAKTVAKSTGKKPAPKKSATAKKTTAKKPTAKKTTTAATSAKKKTTPRRATSTKKTTVAKKAPKVVAS